MLELSPNNLGAMRNLALLYRDIGDVCSRPSIGRIRPSTPPTRSGSAEIKQLRNVLIEIYDKAGEPEQVIAQNELIRALDPEDIQNLQILSQSYVDAVRNGTRLSKRCAHYLRCNQETIAIRWPSPRSCSGSASRMKRLPLPRRRSNWRPTVRNRTSKTSSS